MTETQTQALVRLVRVIIVGALTTLAVQLPEIINLFEIDVTVKAVLIPFLIAVVEAALLGLGGGTVQSTTKTPDQAVKQADLERPSVLSV